MPSSITGIDLPERASNNPEIRRDGKTWFVALPAEDGIVLKAKWEPGLT